MSGHRTSPRYDVVASTRRRFSREQKRAIVAEVESGATVSEVARRHNIHSSLLFRWRRQYAPTTAPASASPSKPDSKAATFLPVRVEAPIALAPPKPSVEATRGSSVIEIELVTGRKLRVGADVDVITLRRIIVALETA
jgi:transposase